MASNIAVLYEDRDIVAIDKPAGVEVTEADAWLKARYPETTLERAYVHRLDRETSGVLLFAKHQEAYDFYRAAFAGREVKKTYTAIVYGKPRENRGTINFSIGRSRKDFRLRSAQPKAKGRLREALTHYEVIKEAGGYSVLRLTPETGRTHQIRVHLKAIHHPVAGDPLYAPQGAQKRGENTLGLSRLALHAEALDLPLLAGGRLVVRAPLPRDLAAAIERIGAS